MIKHIVMWKLKEMSIDEKLKNAQEMKIQLEGLKNKIKQIHSIEVGINMNTQQDAFDVVLCSEFLRQEDLDDYLKHPEHIKVGKFVGNVRESRIVIDYEVDIQ